MVKIPAKIKAITERYISLLSGYNLNKNNWLGSCTILFM